MDLYVGEILSLSQMIFAGWHNNQNNTTVLIPIGQNTRSNGLNLQTATRFKQKPGTLWEHFLWIYGTAWASLPHSGSAQVKGRQMELGTNLNGWAEGSLN